MASVVIIHAAENALPARALADKMRAMRLTPVIEVPPGDALREAISSAVAAVALWSPQSVEQHAIVSEADYANQTGKLINARMQNTPAPGQFRAAPTIDLTGWRGEDTFPGWRALAEQVAAKAGVAVPAPPPPLPPPGGFFTPGAPSASAAQAAPRPAPPPRMEAPPEPVPLRPAPPPLREVPRFEPPPPAFAEPPRRGASLVLIGIVTFLVVAAVGVGGYFFYDRMQSAQAASTAWEHVDKTDSAAIRAFLASANVGNLREPAQAALESLELERLSEARATDTIQSLEKFIRDFPDSRHALEINGRIAELRSAPPSVAIDPATGLPIDGAATPALAPSTGLTPAPGPSDSAPAQSGGPIPLTPPEQTLHDTELQTQSQ